MKRDFLQLSDYNKDELTQLIDRALELKQATKARRCPKALEGRTLVMIFEKSSTRTRVSFEVGMYQLGGHSIYLNQAMSQLGRGESYADTAQVLSRYADGVVFRTFGHEHIEELAQHASVPVINGLTDRYHPCQVMADLVTLKEKGIDLETMVASYIGDGNNMTHSWMAAAAIFGFEFRVATPEGFEAEDTVIDQFKGHQNIKLGHDPKEAVRGCHVVNTDTWFSMGQEVSDEKRSQFWPYQLNDDLIACADQNVLVMHCLPAHRGEEITDDIIDGKHSVVFDQAENRTYAQMAILEHLMK